MFHRLTVHDHRLLDALARREAPRWCDRGFRLLTHAGGASITVGISLALLLIPATRHLGLVVGIANLISHLAVQVLKRAVVRPRPSTILPEVTALAELPDHFSFPSGHAAAAMSLAMGTLLTEPLIGIPAMVVAFLVGASRVYLRVHYVTDVVVGQTLGAAAALLVHLSLA
jgi:undecaprenyl-diphosphatase